MEYDDEGNASDTDLFEDEDVGGEDFGVAVDWSMKENELKAGAETCPAAANDNMPFMEHCGIEAKKNPRQDRARDSSSSRPSQEEPISRMALNTHKAGMEGVDRDRINSIILEASKGSRFYQNEVRKEKQVSVKIEAMLAEVRKVTAAQRQLALREVDQEVERLEANRDLSRIIVHIDMDAFYAAVEMRECPRLREVPMAVGSSSMLSTSNYLARRFGVRAAMPGFIGKKLCPDLVIVRPHFHKYQEVSAEVRRVLESYDPNLCPMGMDEFYLDLTPFVVQSLATRDGDSDATGTYREHQTSYNTNTYRDESNSKCTETPQDTAVFDGTDIARNKTGHNIDDLRRIEEESSSSQGVVFSNRPRTRSKLTLPRKFWIHAQEIVEQMRAEIFKQTSLTASAGIAPNKMLAKIASDLNKPNGQHFVEPTREGILEFVRKLLVRKISGIGRVTERMLSALDITMCRDLFQQRALLSLLFSKTSSHFFLCISLGIGSNCISRDYERKSVGTERTFSEISDRADLESKCHELCLSLASEMKEERLQGLTVTLKFKTVLFEVKSRSASLSKAVSRYEDIFPVAVELLRAEIKACHPEPLRLRLMGVRVSSLQSTGHQHKRAAEAAHTTLDLKRFFVDQATTASAGEGEGEGEGEESVGTGDSTAPCPVCGDRITRENAAFNSHVDQCLNRRAIQEALALTMATTSTCSSAGGGAVAASSATAKRKPSPASPAARKHRKTLHHYFGAESMSSHP